MYHLDSCGNPNEMMAINKKRASNVARPLRSFENEAPPCRTTPDARVRTMMDMLLPIRPKMETTVSKMPSVTNRNMSSFGTCFENKRKRLHRSKLYIKPRLSKNQYVLFAIASRLCKEDEALYNQTKIATFSYCFFDCSNLN